MPASGTQRAVALVAVFVAVLGLGVLAWPSVMSTARPILAGTQQEYDVPAGATATLDGRTLEIREQKDPAAPDVVLRRYVVITAPRQGIARPLDLVVVTQAARPAVAPPTPAPTPTPGANPIDAVASPVPPDVTAAAPAATEGAPGATFQEHHTFRVVPRNRGFIAFGLALLLLCALPYTLVSDDSAQKHGAFYALLVDNGKLSLGRFQFLLWFAPAFGMYAALSVPLAEFAPMTSTLALLLGLSGITAGLSAGARNPTPPSGGARMSQVVEGDNEQPEVSRYQYLVLSLLGSIVLTVAFLRTLAVPDIPAEFLFLVGASQGTFVLNKKVTERS